MLKENLDSKIESFDGNGGNSNKAQTVHRGEQDTNPAISAEEMSDIFKRLNQCEEKAALVSLIDPYAVQFILKKSQHISINRFLQAQQSGSKYSGHLRGPFCKPLFSEKVSSLKIVIIYLFKCTEDEINISKKEIEMVEQDTRTHAKGPGVFRHQAGRIGACICGPVYHTNLAQLSLSLTNSICYPHLFKLNNKAIKHGWKHVEHSIKTYEQ